jgi:hypothetical protein
MQRIVWSLFAMLPAVAFAHGEHSYRCTQGEAVRRVEIVHATEAPVPCSVNYHKDTEAPGAPQELWNAANDPAYCETQAQDFVARLESLGWQCEAVAVRETAGE